MEKPVLRDALQTPASAPASVAAPEALDETALAAFACDVAFVSDESLSADALVADAAEQLPEPDLRPVLLSAYERIRGIYETGEQGGMIAHPSRLRAIVRQAATPHGIDPFAHSLQLLLPFFDRVNRILFQQQTLAWLQGSDLKVHVYGHGWENHPALGELARGPITDAKMHRAVWQASRIHLAASPFGAATEEVQAGIRDSGAFYLMRFCPADLIERFYPPIADFCRSRGIKTTLELRSLAPRAMRKLIGFASRTLGMDVLSEWDEFVPHILDLTASDAPARSAAAIWSGYPAVCFHSRDELLAQCTRYLYDVPQRRRLAEQMRRELAEASSSRLTVTVNRELLTRLSATGEVAA